jgi:hypothetical protein
MLTFIAGKNLQSGSDSSCKKETMKQPYSPPTLEAQPEFALLIGISLPIGVLGAEPMSDFLQTEMLGDKQ